MPTLHVDSSLIPGVHAPITVDALLSAIEPVLGGEGRIVTAVRINGVGEPAFRDAAVLTRTLGEEDTLDIETTSAGDLARQALDEAAGAIPLLTGDITALAQALRLPTAPEHRAAIGGLAENLALLTTLVQTADVWARQAGVATTDWLGEDVAAVDEAAQALGEATLSEDWVSAADVLEYDLNTALDAWRQRLAAAREHTLASLTVA